MQRDVPTVQPRGSEDAPQPAAADAVSSSSLPARGQQAVLAILVALSFSHLLNDAIQALLPSVYPLLKDSFGLNFTQIGLITFTFQMTGSVFQPLVGLYTDRHPKPYSLALGMTITLGGLVFLAYAPSYPAVIAAAALVGLGSAIFHPESSRMARLASGGRHGFAQSLFQVGGNAGSALGPLLAALIVVPYGQRHILWFSLAALAGIVILMRVGTWYRGRLAEGLAKAVQRGTERPPLPRRTVVLSLGILLTLVFSKYFYLVSMTSYYTFYLMGKFNVSVQDSQFLLFAFLGAVAAGTIIGGPVGDRFGRKWVIWASIVGMAPFSLLLPHVGLVGTAILSVLIGLVMASAFSAILVYATELVPGRVGLIAGLFFGFAFGMAGIGAAVLGKLADRTSIDFVYQVCAFLPLIGLLTGFLPDIEGKKRD
ncbi:MFS transporter, FSR family, fosmidomycin resistance protein [Verrucomicrobium sp. GAS474]|uniref:MFS transporter n=1 Tax=Verrucomicrobium sp. GAS474 TaxID=1882831 RepID=UPI000879F504|nr:MFS transporter [Verrucomicrobium sp. GAS474]SDT91162.1 MFS transporter, FSR family, fosmidomycin resistance protein [Verrucomicrobium sp. GAS474]